MLGAGELAVRNTNPTDKGLVLVVDDDPIVRDSMTEQLDVGGYSCSRLKWAKGPGTFE